MKSLAAYLIATIGVASVWAMSSVLPFVLLAGDDLEHLIHPTGAQWGLLTLAHAGGAIFWYILCVELAALAGRRATIAWAMFQTSLALIALPVVGNQWLPMLMLFGVMGVMPAALWAVWFPLVHESDHQLRPSAVAGFFVVLYTVTSMALPIGVQVMKLRGSTQTLMGMGAAGLGFSMLTAIASKSMLRSTRSKAPTSLMRLTREDIGEMTSLSFVFLFLFGILTYPLLFQTTTAMGATLAQAQLGRLSDVGIGMILALGPVPALAVLLLAMPSLKDSVPLRYLGLGMMVAAVGMVVIGKATHPFVFLGGYLGYFAGVGLCWTVYYSAIMVTATRDVRVQALLVAGLGLTMGMAAAGAAHYGLLLVDLPMDMVFALIAAVAGGCGALLWLGSLFAALNGHHQGGHFGEERTPQGNFKRFTYGNPRE